MYHVGSFHPLMQHLIKKNGEKDKFYQRDSKIMK